MKDYKRLTDRVIAEMLRNTEEESWDSDNIEAQCYIRLAELEDKIERGELISTVQDERGEQETTFSTKHDVKVCKEVVKECLQVLRDIRVTHIYDDYEWGWNSGIDMAIKRLAERYDIDVR